MTLTTTGRSLLALLGTGAVVAATAAAAPFAAAGDIGAMTAATTLTSLAADPGTRVEKSDRGQYVVYLEETPAVAYAGGTSGLAATKAASGARYDSTTAAVAEYVQHLDTRRQAVLRAADVPSSALFYTYDHSVVGFAARLSYAQAQDLARTPGVLSVSPDLMHEADTSHTPTFLGLDDPDSGLWSQLGGPEGLGGAGEDLVIGVIDSGFTPDSGSFAPLDPPPAQLIPDGWNGTCEPGDPDDVGGGPYLDGEGDDPAAITCQEVDGGYSIVNSKVIGARSFGAGSPQLPAEFLSPRDYNGHGSNTASIALGNHAVPVEVSGNPLGEISGMAPRARLAVYKGLWQNTAGGSSGSGSDLIAAVDQAVADGVDVINYSISGPATTAVSGVAVPFLFAAEAGIFVAVSAGNNGPTGSTVAHNYPWVNTTAASTQDRRFEVTVTLGNGDTYTGVGIGAAVPETDAVYAGAIPLEGFEAEAAYCQPGSLDPELAAGKVVVCDRGLGIARTAKSDAVAEAGGVGMVLANDQPNGGSVVTERHAVPTAHVSYQDGIAIKEYVGVDDPDPDATIALSASEEVVGDGVTAPEMASFSSRGPSGVANGDILKPDITAPGVDILGSVAPTAANAYELYGLVSGTSQASPHIAGIGALLRDLHPDWSPMAIKSAIVTSGYQNNNQGNPIQALDPDTGELVAATPLNYGGGHVDPQAAAAIPAVYDSGYDEWVQFLCGTELSPTDPPCDTLGSIDASDLNLPSIAIGDLAGTQTVTRTLTNVTGEPLTLTGEVDVDGVTATLSADTLEIPAGGSAEYTVEFTTNTADLDAYTFGAVTWTEQGGDQRTVRSPVAIRPVAIGGAEQLLVGEGSTGSVTDSLVSGTDQMVDVQLGGLEPGQLDTGVLSGATGSFPSTDPESCLADPACAVHVLTTTVEVPAGAYAAHFALYEEDYVPGTDLDLYVYLEADDGSLTLAGSSASGIAGESVLLGEPEAGTYHVYVDLFAAAEGEDEVTANLYSWAVTDADVDSFSVDPGSFQGTIGGAVEQTFSWSDLAVPPASATEPARYLGTADYVVDGVRAARTMVRVDVQPGVVPTTPPPTTQPPTSEPPTTPPTGPPTSEPPTPSPTGTLPFTGGSDTGLFVGLGLAAMLLGGLFVAVAARRLREGTPAL